MLFLVLQHLCDKISTKLEQISLQIWQTIDALVGPLRPEVLKNRNWENSCKSAPAESLFLENNNHSTFLQKESARHLFGREKKSHSVRWLNPTVLKVKARAKRRTWVKITPIASSNSVNFWRTGDVSISCLSVLDSCSCKSILNNEDNKLVSEEKLKSWIQKAREETWLGTLHFTLIIWVLITTQQTLC